MEEKILELIYTHGETRSENFGVTLADLEAEFSIKSDEIKTILNSLFSERKIVVKKTPFHSLIFYNYDTDALSKASKTGS